MRVLIAKARATFASVALLLALALALALASGGSPSEGRPSPRLATGAASVAGLARLAPPALPGGRTPSAAALRAARRFAARRVGAVAFAVKRSTGRPRGRETARPFPSASLVKPLLLAAELARLERDDLPLDAATESTLRAMITVSDNDAASRIYARVGDAGLVRIAAEAGLEDFAVAGYWSSAKLTAADMARFFSRLDQVFARRHRKFALGLLGSIAAEQSWGIPAAAGAGWAVRFKGGWLPARALVHQAAELRERRGAAGFALAVLTDAQPSFSYGVETVRGIAERLLRTEAR